MFKFLRIQYKLGKVSEQELIMAVAKGFITEVQREMIVSEDGS